MHDNTMTSAPTNYDTSTLLLQTLTPTTADACQRRASCCHDSVIIDTARAPPTYTCQARHGRSDKPCRANMDPRFRVPRHFVLPPDSSETYGYQYESSPRRTRR